MSTPASQRPYYRKVIRASEPELVRYRGHRMWVRTIDLECGHNKIIRSSNFDTPAATALCKDCEAEKRIIKRTKAPSPWRKTNFVPKPMPPAVHETPDSTSPQTLPVL